MISQSRAPVGTQNTARETTPSTFAQPRDLSLKEGCLNPGGFLGTFPPDLQDVIRNSTVACVSIEVTAATRHSEASRLHKETLIGGVPWKTYRAMNTGVVLRSKPRIKSVSISVPIVGQWHFDWDSLRVVERERLLTTLFSGPAIVGHDLCTLFSWLFAETAARPKEGWDTMLLVQHLQPKVLYHPFVWAASSNAEKRMQAENHIRAWEQKAVITLGYISYCLGVKCFESELVDSASWCLSRLSLPHLDHCKRKLNCIQEIADKLLPGGIDRFSVEAIRKEAPLYRFYSTATLRLSEAHVRGTPFATEAAADFRDSCPTLPQAERTQLKSLQRAAKGDERLHSLFTFGTLTGRTTSRYPAIQNTRNAPRWRSLIRARGDCRILSVDYSTIELRIACALAARAIDDIRRSLAASVNDPFLRGVAEGAAGEAVPWPAGTQIVPGSDNTDLARAAAQRVFGRSIQAMQSAFVRNLDLHLATAVHFARCQDILDFEGSALDWLALRSEAETAKLKVELEQQRRSAKACNFGLLYGMSSDRLLQHGVEVNRLTWTRKDAEAMRDAWYELYPEITLWHLWTCHRQSTAIQRHRIRLLNRKAGKFYIPDLMPVVYKTTTLLGRQLAVLNRPNQAYSYQGQGSGADLLAIAISELPPTVADMLLFPVHDELVFEIPYQEVESTKAAICAAMDKAGRTVLGLGIPIGLDITVGETWT